MENLVGHLVSKLGLDQEVSLAIVALLGSAGAAAVVAAWPFLAPFVLTLRGILAIAGSAAVVGY